MKLTLPKACLIFLNCASISAQTPSTNSIDELIKGARGQIAWGDWNDLAGLETWKVDRFLERTPFFNNSVHYAFLTTHGKEFSIIVESERLWPVTDLESVGTTFCLEVDGTRYPFAPKSSEERSVVRILHSTPKIMKLKKSRRYIHVQNLIDAIEN